MLLIHFIPQLMEVATMALFMPFCLGPLQGEFFDLSNLRDKTRCVGLPTAMRRSLMQLYGNINGILRNHHSFDVVLDYLDVFQSFYDFLTCLLPSCFSGKPVRDHPPRASQEVVASVALILNALHDGLKLRLRGAYPETPLRDWSFDFRSSLLQTVLAAEAVLKCSVGILRKDLLGVADEKTERTNCIARHCIGVALHLGFDQGIKVEEIRAAKLGEIQSNGDQQRAYQPRLAIFKEIFLTLLTYLVSLTSFTKPFI